MTLRITAARAGGGWRGRAWQQRVRVFCKMLWQNTWYTANGWNLLSRELESSKWRLRSKGQHAGDSEMMVMVMVMVIVIVMVMVVVIAAVDHT